MSAATNDLTRAEVVRLLAERRADLMAHHDCEFSEQMLDIMIYHGVADHAEIDRLETVIAKLERELAALHATIRDAGPAWWETAFALALIVRDGLGTRWGLLRDSRHRLTITEQLGIFMLLSCVVGVYVRFGV